jgi:hypothetical protein
VYCDTDSIFCEGFNGTVSEELGDWDLEGVYPNLAIAGKKNYVLWGPGQEDKIASKGWKATKEQMIKVCKGGTVLSKREAPTISLRRGFSFIERTIRMT